MTEYKHYVRDVHFGTSHKDTEYKLPLEDK